MTADEAMAHLEENVTSILKQGKLTSKRTSARHSRIRVEANRKRGRKA